MKPTSFSLSSLTASLQKVPRPVLYGAVAAVLLAAGTLWYVNNQAGDPNLAVVTPPPASNPSATATPPSSTSPSAATPAPIEGSDDIVLASGPSRSLEVQPIPFLVTTPLPTDANVDGTQAVQVSSGQGRDTVVSNPFAPLELPPVEVTPGAPVAAVPVNTAPNTPVITPGGAETLPPINARPVQVVQPRPLPRPVDRSLPSLPSNPISRPTQVTPTPRPAPLPTVRTPVVVRNPQTVPTVKPPAAIARSNPVVRPPRATTGDLPEPAQIGGALPITPSLIRQVISAPEPQPTVIVTPPPPVETTPPPPPAAPELSSDLASVSQPQVSDAGSELRGSETTTTDTTPTPLDSSIPRPAPTPVAPPAPPVETTPPAPTATTPPAVTTTRLERFVQDRQVSFVGVVLGPVNTAILTTKDGTVVIPLGGTLPQSDVVVKTVTAEQVVLMQDQDTIVLTRNNK